MGKVIKRRNRLPGEVVESASPEMLKTLRRWQLRTRFDGEHGAGAGLTVAVDDLKSFP